MIFFFKFLREKNRIQEEYINEANTNQIHCLCFPNDWIQLLYERYYKCNHTELFRQIVGSSNQ